MAAELAIQGTVCFFAIVSVREFGHDFADWGHCSGDELEGRGAVMPMS